MFHQIYCEGITEDCQSLSIIFKRFEVPVLEDERALILARRVVVANTVEVDASRFAGEAR